MHVIVVGCGRVGSDGRRQLRPAEHDVVVIDRKAEAFRRLGRRLHGRTMVGRRVRPRRAAPRPVSPDAARSMAVTSGDNSNILIARVARETFGVKRVVARIYDPRRAVDLRAVGHRHRRVRGAGPARARCATCCPTASRRPTGSIRTSQFAIVERRAPAAAAGRPIGEIEARRQARVVLLARFGESHACPAPARCCKQDDVAARHGTRRSISVARRGAASRHREDHTDEGRHRRRRKRRSLHGGSAAGSRVTRSRSSTTTAPVVVAVPRTRTRSASRGTSVTRARSTRSPPIGAAERRRRRSGHGRRRGQPRRLVCSPSRSSPCRGSLPASTTRTTSGCSTTCGASTSRCRLRTCSPRSSKKRSPSVRSCGCSSLEGGKARAGRGHAGRRVAGHRQRARRARACPASRRSWPCCATATWSCPAATPCCSEGDEVLVLVTGDVEDDVRRALVG